MVPAGAGAGYEGSNALTAFPEVVEDMLDLHEWVVERCAIVVEGVGADVAHELGQQVVFALKEAVECRAAYVSARDDVADGNLAVVLFA